MATNQRSRDSTTFLFVKKLTSFFLGFDFSEDEAVSVLFLPPSAEHHAGAEERDTVEIGEDDGETCVQTEQLYRAELCDGTDTERQDVCKKRWRQKFKFIHAS